MKIRILIILGIGTVLWNVLIAQNLVPNYSFEIKSQCPDYTGQIHYAPPWFQPNICCGIGGSSDYYNPCDSFPVGVPKNVAGFQFPRTGNGYAGIAVSANDTFGYNEWREYLEVQLNSSLDSGKKYCVQFYISKAEFAYNSIDVIGAYFSNDSLLYNDGAFTYLPFQPQIVNTVGNIIKDTLNWVLIFDEFIANGGEKFITIGNFFPDSLTNTDTSDGAAYYYIDDVSVMLCDDTCKAVPPVASFNSYNTDTFTVSFNDLSTATANNWLWYFGDGTSETAQNPVHSYENAGTYKVTFIACDSNCCSTFEEQVVVGEVGAKELLENYFVSHVYPNPNDGTMKLDYILPEKYNAKLFIYDVIGNIMDTYRISGRGQLHINNSKLSNGIYYYEVKSGKDLLIKEKLIIIIK